MCRCNKWVGAGGGAEGGGGGCVVVTCVLEQVAEQKVEEEELDPTHKDAVAKASRAHCHRYQ